MNEYLRKDTGASPEQEAPIAETELRAKAAERAAVNEADSRTATSSAPSIEPRTPVAASPASAPTVAGNAGTGTATARAQDEQKVALFAPNEANDFRARWDSIQVGFVDEPRKAVQEADALVSATITRLSEIFSSERHALEEQWDRNENVSTEDLRIALRRYRSFFGRLLAI